MTGQAFSFDGLHFERNINNPVTFQTPLIIFCMENH